MDKDIRRLLGVYVRKQCTPAEAMRVKEYLVEHPEHIVSLIIEMRSSMMEDMKLDASSDPFRELMVEVIKLTQTNYKIANYQLREAIGDFIDENFFGENVPNKEDVRIVSENKQNSSYNMKTINLTSAEYQAINASAARMMENIDPEKSTLGNMVAQLLIQMPEMNPDEASKVCRQLLEGVAKFNQVMEGLKEKDASAEETANDVYSQCVEILYGKPEKEQAAILINFISFVKYIDAVNIGGAVLGEESKTMEQLLSEGASIEGDITPEILDALKEQLKQAIADSTIILTQEADMRELISSATGDSSLAEELAKKHMEGVEFKGYAALAAYIACLKGEVKGCDANNVQPDILGASVAAGVERERVMEEAKRGFISWEKAVKYLKWIGGALLTALFAWVAFKLTLILFSATAVITAVLLDTTFIGMVAGLIIGGFVCYKGAKWFVDHVSTPIINGAGEAYDKVVGALKSGAVMETVKKAYANTITFLKTVWQVVTLPFSHASQGIIIN